MGYLACDKCGEYYKLKEGEYIHDFDDKCECGGTLKYTENLDEVKERPNIKNRKLIIILVPIFLLAVLALFYAATIHNNGSLNYSTSKYITGEDKAISIVKNYPGRGGHVPIEFYINSTLEGLDKNTQTKHSKSWTASKISEKEYEVVFNVNPNEMDVMKCIWTVNINTGIVTPTGGQAFAFMD